MWSLADIHSVTPLLNSLFFEWKNYALKTPFIVLDHGGMRVQIEIKKFSTIGHHQYTGLIYLEEKELSFDEFLLILCDILAVQKRENFIARIKQSRDSIAQALELNFNHFSNIKINFKHTETALFVGHSLHPTPKSRSEFSSADLIKYSAEHGAEFNLSWFKIHHSIFLEKHSHCFKDLNWQETLTSFSRDEDFKLLPVHPWQKEHILKNKTIQEYLATGLIKDLGEDKTPWTPTSSLRTIYHPRAKYMLKFSMSLKMTNSIRHLLIHELERGIQIDEISNHHHLSSFFNEFKDFKIIQEPLYAGILDKSGTAITESLIMLRENPFAENDEVSLLATLTQGQVENKQSVLAELIEKSQLTPLEWFSSFLVKAIEPLLIAQGSFGVLLGAHQQNLILKLEQGKPCGAYFRDCHGTGYDAKKIEQIRSELTSITDDNGNILSKEISHYLFAYYVVINSVFNMITAISFQTNTEEENLLKVFQDFLMKLKQRPHMDTEFIDYLLYSQELKHKGNFFCTLANINENTASNPLDIYVSIPNPLKEFANA